MRGKFHVAKPFHIATRGVLVADTATQELPSMRLHGLSSSYHLSSFFCRQTYRNFFALMIAGNFDEKWHASTRLSFGTKKFRCVRRPDIPERPKTQFETLLYHHKAELGGRSQSDDGGITDLNIDESAEAYAYV